MAANQAKEVTVKQVVVVPSRTVPQGIGCDALAQSGRGTGFRCREDDQSLERVQTGEITMATRNVEIDGVKVKEGQVIALLDGKLVVSAGSVEEGCLGSA